jgi:hypothetical protein
MAMLAQPAVAAADPDTELQQEGISLMRQLEGAGRDARDHTDRLQTLSRQANISRWTHFHHLDGIRDTVNGGVRPALVRLTAIQARLPAWKQPAVDQLLVLAQALAADATSAFVEKRESRAIVPKMNQEYQRRLADMRLHAEALAIRAEAAASYAEGQLRAVGAEIRN